MIANWMLQGIVVSALLAIAAMATERTLRLWRREARYVWGAAMVGSLALPILGVAQAAGWLRPLSALRAVPELTPTPFAVLLAPVRVNPAFSRLDLVLVVMWILLAVGLTIRFLLVSRTVRRRRAVWRPARVDGQPVYISRDSGPAVVGIRKPIVVIPEWVLELDRPLRALVLCHEREHIDGHDLRLLLGAVAVATIAPWNLISWFQLHRLRSAMELDCDRRVLRAHPDARRYGSLLLAVAQRADRGALLQAALTESHSLLARRISGMRTQISSFRITQSLLLTAAAVLIGVIACDVQSAEQPKAAAVERVSGTVSPVVATEPYFEFQVENPVTPAAGTPPPRYPDALRRAGVEGEVLAQFVVGPDGRADVETFKVLKSTDPLFVEAVRKALPLMRFNPALVGGRAVRQLVQSPFTFSMAK